MRPFILALLLLAAPAAVAQTPQPIPFSPREEAIFRDLVGRDRAKPAELKESLAVGAQVPLDIELQMIPGGIATEVPVLRTYRYITTPAGIVLVDGDTRRVVQIFAPR
jgi:hypothetical protein